ncbi:hypothetical protein SDC9_53340 [bioreactor metagenome]|uniref:Uncharacterized protein n=1 Tax=bioreactor metagenome TaxID=1076179 RepID=A0A644WSY4_9ZZZZ
MRSFVLIIFIFISAIGFSQIVSFNETTQLLNKPHGKPLFQINAGVEYNYYYPGYADVWREIYVSCYAKKSDINKNIIASGSVLYDYKNDSIGCVLQKCSCSSSISYLIDCENPDTAQFTMVGLNGYIEDEKLQNNQTVSEIINLNNGFADSCQSRIIDYRNTIGVRFSIVENCEIKFPFIKQENDYKQILVKEKTKTIMPYGNADGDFRSMVVEIVLDYDTDNPKIFVISNEAYECVFDYDQILFTERNWSAGPDHRYQYSVTTFEPLMEFLGQVYKVKLPKSNITGFIGYYSGYWIGEESIPGTLTFTDGSRVILKKNIVCNNPDIASKLMWTDPIIEFKPKNNKDEVSPYDSLLFVLNSKQNCTGVDCLTDFGIILHLTETGEDISLELEFRDGDIFIVKNYEDAFELR